MNGVLGCVTAALLVISCSERTPSDVTSADASPGDDAGAVIDSTTPQMEIEPGYFVSLNDGIKPLEDNGPLPLRIAPQGGHYAFVAARVKNITVPEVHLTVTFRDAKSSELLLKEERDGALVPSEDDPEWLEPADRARGSIVHVPVCPVETPPGLYQRTIDLEMEVVENSSEARSASAKIRVTPDCIVGTDFELAYCRCECAVPYDPGKCVDL